MKKLFLTATLLLSALFALHGCVVIDLESEFEHDARLQAQILDQTSDHFADIDPLSLSDELKQRLDKFVGLARDDRTRIERLQDFLYGENQLAIEYSAERTHTAMELYESRSGNCLSAMNLYVALARHLGVEARFQRVDVQPSWDKRGGLLVLSQHINATGRFNQTIRYVVDFTPEIALQQLTSKIISDNEARALYFNNLGVEQLVAGQYEVAVDYLKNALFLQPDNAIFWNNIGASFSRLGRYELAEYSYRKAYELDANSSTAIANLAKFYRAQGDQRRAQEYEVAIERFNQKNPYYHYAQGSIAYERGALADARASFERAIELKEEEPDFYIALSEVVFAQGNLPEARKLRREADDLVRRNADIYRPSEARLRVLGGDEAKSAEPLSGEKGE